MKNNVSLLIAIISIILVGGIVVYATQKSSQDFSDTNTTSTPREITSENDSDTISVKSTVQAGIPTIATNENVVTTETTAIVTGKVTPNGAFTRYWYEYGTTENLGKKNDDQMIGSGFVSIPAPGYLTGLSKDTIYFFRLAAENKFGLVTGNKFKLATKVGNPPLVGNAPTVKTFNANGISRTTANLNGEVNPNKSSTQFWFEYGETTQLGFATSLMNAGETNNNIPASLSISNLSPDTRYYFRMNAQNQFGTINGAILNFKTLGPATASLPSFMNLNASVLSSSSATLRAVVNPHGLETNYWFEYSTNSNLNSSPSKSTDHVSVGSSQGDISVNESILNLNSATTYYFRIVAQNNLGTTKSDTLNFKTSDIPPITAIPTVTTRSANSITSSSVKLFGSVNPKGLETTYWFEFSTKQNFEVDATRSTDRISAGSGLELKSVSETIPNLKSKTTYYFRIVAQNNLGTSQGEGLSFKTK